MQNFTIYICVNQPDSWWGDGNPEHLSTCLNNAKLLAMLPQLCPNAVVIDRSTKGSGWSGRKKGVGWARKELFSCILNRCDENDIIVSLDADTTFPDDYLEIVQQAMVANPEAGAVQVPYYHKLSNNDEADRRLLRYECYMRHYFCNLLAIDNPHAISALGSAMAFTAQAYRRAGGITPLQGGEDFYLMEKFAKTTLILCTLDSCVYPSGRLSQRVPFGTGPAMGMNLDEQAAHYPFYNSTAFGLVKETFAMFPALYEHDIETPMSQFLRQQLGTDDLWSPLRKNFKTKELFVRACAEKVDGLRILQFLRHTQQTQPPDAVPVDFKSDTVEELDRYRNTLVTRELALRKEKKFAGIARYSK